MNVGFSNQLETKFKQINDAIAIAPNLASIPISILAAGVLVKWSQDVQQVSTLRKEHTEKLERCFSEFMGGPSVFTNSAHDINRLITQKKAALSKIGLLIFSINCCNKLEKRLNERVVKNLDALIDAQKIFKDFDKCLYLANAVLESLPKDQNTTVRKIVYLAILLKTEELQKRA